MPTAWFTIFCCCLCSSNRYLTSAFIEWQLQRWFCHSICALIHTLSLQFAFINGRPWRSQQFVALTCAHAVSFCLPVCCAAFRCCCCSHLRLLALFTICLQYRSQLLSLLVSLCLSPIYARAALFLLPYLQTLAWAQLSALLLLSHVLC